MSQQVPSVNYERVLNRVAAALHVTVASLPTEWATLASQAAMDASEDIITLLALKGYTGDEIAQADQMPSWVDRRAFCLVMQRATALAQYPLEQLKGIDPFETIEKAAAILINRVPTAPGTSSDLAPVQSGTITGVTNLETDFSNYPGVWGRGWRSG